MHEMAIAEGAVRIALERAGGRRIRGIGMVVGQLRQVVPDALTFGFQLLTSGTEAEGAELEIEHVEAAGICGACDAETGQTGFPLRCGECGALDVRIVRGEELRVEWLDLEVSDDPVPHSTRSRSPEETRDGESEGDEDLEFEMTRSGR